MIFVEAHFLKALFPYLLPLCFSSFGFKSASFILLE